MERVTPTPSIDCQQWCYKGIAGDYGQEHTPSSPAASSFDSQRDRSSESKPDFGKGQLKLGISVQQSTLCIFFQEASGLKSQWRPKSSAYIQTQICPDDNGKSRQQTKAIPENNCPSFNQTIKYQLENPSPKQRLMISVWHQDPVKKCAEFIGCLSFGVSHLVAKCRKSKEGVSGWYYLLSAEIGHRKHILARPAEVTGNGEDHQAVLEDKENSDKYEHLTLEMKHRQPGYGFTVRGPHPIRVGRIKAGGPAHMSGLKKGDIILRINGQTMAGKDMQLVAEIIRASDVQVVMDVLRPVMNTVNQKSSDVQSFQMQFNKEKSTRCLFDARVATPSDKKRKCESPVSDSDDTCKSKQMKVANNECDNNQNLFSEGLFCKPCGKEMLDVKEKNCEHVKVITNHLSPCNTQKLSKKSTESNALSKYKKWNPEISSITAASSRVFNLVDSVISADCTSVTEELNHRLDTFSTTATSSLCGGLVNTPLYNTIQNSTVESNIKDSDIYINDASTTQSHSFINKNNTTVEYPTRSSSPASSVTESRVADMTDFDNLTGLTGIECSFDSENQIKRDLSVRTLVKCEEEFVKCMQKGIQTYSRPLRFCVLTAEQNEVLFQNVEKLVAISQYNLSQMIDSQLYSEQTVNGTLRDGSSPVEGIGAVYRSTVTMLCHAYTEYIEGMQASLEILRKLRQYPEFEQLLQKQRSKCDLDIVDFLQQPFLHFEFLHRGFEDIYTHTDCGHEDFPALQKVVDQFAETCSLLL